jgi:hypothetical protein
MRIPRFSSVVLALLVLVPGASRAQQPDTSMQQAYTERRAALVKDLQDAQAKLDDLRSQRVKLEAQIENALAQSTQRRAQQLLLSKEQTALLQLDAVLASAQENMQGQRDRMQALGDAVRRRTGAVLVVLLRADSVPVGNLGAVQLRIDDAAAASRTYTSTAAAALQAGAVDQLYRADVLPTGHLVSIDVTIGGQTVKQQLNVSAQGETVTYVQFAIQRGELVPTTWTGRGPTPF